MSSFNRENQDPGNQVSLSRAADMMNSEFEAWSPDSGAHTFTPRTSSSEGKKKTTFIYSRMYDMKNDGKTSVDTVTFHTCVISVAHLEIDESRRY